jgi:hypothetical protein
MKFSFFTKFGALNSPPVFDAFAKGLTKHNQTIVEHDMTADVAVIWSVLWNGRMRPSQEVFNKFRQTNRPVIVLEVGCLNRDITWKIGINGVNRDNFSWAENYNRAYPALLTLKDHRSNGNEILICTQNPLSEQWRGQPIVSKWLDNLLVKIRQHSDRPVIVRAHPRVPVQFNLSNYKNVSVVKPHPLSNDQMFINAISTARFMINHNSNPAIIAAIEGLPVYVDSTSMAWDISNKSLDKIENPDYIDKTQWLEKIKKSEYTIDEIKRGDMLSHLLQHINTNY